mgnify:CR=1 FL=1
MQTNIFWISGIVFFAVQIRILLSLLRQRRQADPSRSEAIHTEIVWTLVPAALVTAIAIMVSQEVHLEIGRTTPANEPVLTELRPGP